MIIICQRKLPNLHHPIFQDTSTLFTFSFCLHFIELILHSCYCIKDLISVRLGEGKVSILPIRFLSSCEKYSLLTRLYFSFTLYDWGDIASNYKYFLSMLSKGQKYPQGWLVQLHLYFSSTHWKKKKQLLLLHVKFLSLLFSCTIVTPQLYLLLLWLNILL